MNDVTSGQDVCPAIAVEAGLFNWSHDFRLPLGVGETLMPQPSGPGPIHLATLEAIFTLLMSEALVKAMKQSDGARGHVPLEAL